MPTPTAAAPPPPAAVARPAPKPAAPPQPAAASPTAGADKTPSTRGRERRTYPRMEIHVNLFLAWLDASGNVQKEEQTIASQTAGLQEYAAATGLEVPAEWVFEDEGFSGATLVRPALERLRDLVADVEAKTPRRARIEK